MSLIHVSGQVKGVVLSWQVSLICLKDEVWLRSTGISFTLYNRISQVIVLYIYSQSGLSPHRLC